MGGGGEAGFDLFPEGLGALGEEGAAFRELGFAGGAVFVGDLREVVEVVEEDVLEMGDAGVDVAGEREVDEEERAGGAFLDGGLGGVAGDDGAGGGGGADDDVEFGETGFALLERHGAGAESGGELHGTFEAAGGDGEAAGVAGAEGLGGFFADVAGAEEEDARGAEFAEDGLGEIDGDVGDAHMALGDGGVGADVFRGLEGFLENAVEDGAGVAAGLGEGVGVFDLTEDFGFADHLGVDAGGDFEEVMERGGAAEVEAEAFELGGIDVLLGAEGGLDLGDGGGIAGDAVEFDAVAGVEERELAHGAELGELAGETRGGVGIERQPLADGERSGVMRGAEDEERFLAHRGTT